MRNSKGIKAVLTGIFVIAGIAILLAGVFILGGKDKTFKKGVSANALFMDVNGLAKGSNVWYEGVKIGVVKKVTFADSGVMVNFTIEEEVQKKIRMDTKVKLSTDGLIGNKILVLFGGSNASPEITPGNILQVENGISTDQIMATLQNNNKNLLEITDNLKMVSKALVDGKGTLGKLLNDPSINDALQATMVTLNHAGYNAQTFTANLSEFSKKLNSKGYFFNDIATDTTIVASLKQTAVQFHQVSQKANEVVENLDATTSMLNSNKSPVGVLLHDETAAVNIQHTLNNLDAGTKKLDENMEALQHNFLLRGFFKKRARAEEKKMSDSLRNTVYKN